MGDLGTARTAEAIGALREAAHFERLRRMSLLGRADLVIAVSFLPWLLWELAREVPGAMAPALEEPLWALSMAAVLTGVAARAYVRKAKRFQWRELFPQEDWRAGPDNVDAYLRAAYWGIGAGVVWIAANVYAFWRWPGETMTILAANLVFAAVAFAWGHLLGPGQREDQRRVWRPMTDALAAWFFALLFFVVMSFQISPCPACLSAAVWIVWTAVAATQAFRPSWWLRA